MSLGLGQISLGIEQTSYLMASGKQRGNENIYITKPFHQNPLSSESIINLSINKIRVLVTQSLPSPGLEHSMEETWSLGDIYDPVCNNCTFRKSPMPATTDSMLDLDFFISQNHVFLFHDIALSSWILYGLGVKEASGATSPALVEKIIETIERMPDMDYAIFWNLACISTLPEFAGFCEISKKSCYNLVITFQICSGHSLYCC